MRIGYAREEITPGVSMHMAGYDRRKIASTGTLDPLYVHAAAFREAGSNSYLLLSFDLIGTDTALSNEIRTLASDRFGLAKEYVTVCATHTHSGPSSVLKKSLHYDREYVELLIEKTMMAAEKAFSDAWEAEVSYFPVRVQGVASLRDEGRGDSEFAMNADTLSLAGQGGELLLCSYSCHSTVLNEQNTLFSRDLPGACARALPKESSSLFLNGACADLSTRYSRRSSTPQELERLGNVWAGAIVQARADAMPCKISSIQAVDGTAFLPGKEGFSEEEQEQLMKEVALKLEQCTDGEQKREYLARLSVLERGRYTAIPGNEIDFSLVDLGCVTLLCLPLEVRHETGEKLKQIISERTKRPVWIVGYANGYEGYLASTRPLDFESGYEDLSSRYSHLAQQVLYDRIEKTVKAFLV
jgi:hypothetical protein